MSTFDEINNALGSLWASFVDKMEFNFPNLQMTLSLLNYESNEVRKHKLIFEGISSFFFVNGEGNFRFNTTKWENAELSEAYYFETPRDHIVHKSDKEGTPQFQAEPNFYLEIWNSVLMIEAKATIIDGSRYEIY